MTNNNKPMTETEKQKTPLPGEVSPKDAFVKSRQMAAQEAVKLKAPRPQ